MPRQSLHIRNLSFDTRAEDLRRIFEKYGEVRDIYLPKDYYTRRPKGIAYVEFIDERDASDARERADGLRVDGREIVVEFARGGRKTSEEMRGRDRRSRHSRSPSRGRRYRSRSRSRGRYRRSRSFDRDHHSGRRRELERYRSDRDRYRSRSPPRISRRERVPSRSVSRDRTPVRDVSRSRSPSPKRSRSLSPRNIEPVENSPQYSNAMDDPVDEDLKAPGDD